MLSKIFLFLSNFLRMFELEHVDKKVDKNMNHKYHIESNKILGIELNILLFYSIKLNNKS